MMLVFQNEAFIADLIAQAHAGNGYDVRRDPMFDDFVRIGSLLTKSLPCFSHLVQLNDELVLHAEALGVLKRMTTSKAIGKSHTLKTQDTVDGPSGSRYEGRELRIHKHYKVVTSFFAHYEAKAGFNTGTLPEELDKKGLAEQLPDKPATLTRFVNAADFRKYLFRYAYHWKDAGVGWGHGEFTHRIHWYIVNEYLQDHPKWLDHKPIELFRACARPQWRHGTDKDKGVWDDVVDDLTSKDTFRSPETLHKYLKDAAEPSDPAHKPLWFLAQLIAGRAAKRLKEKTTEFPVPEGATTVAGKSIMWKEA